MLNQILYSPKVIRSSAVLTTGHVASTILDDCLRFSQLELLCKYTKGSLTSVEILVEVSINGTDYFQDTNVSVTTGTSTLSPNEFTYTGATGNFIIRLPVGYQFIKVSAKGTGTVTNSLLALTAVLTR